MGALENWRNTWLMAKVSIERSAIKRAPNNAFLTILRLRTIARFFMGLSVAGLYSGALIEKNKPEHQRKR